MREVEAHHSAAIKYVIAHSGYAGRNGNSGELGAIHECMLGEFLQVVRESDTREIGTSVEHFCSHFTHIPGKRNALKSGSTLEAARQLIHPFALEDYLLEILAIGKGCATNDFHRCGKERRDKTNRKTANYNRRQSFFSKVCLLFGFFSYQLFVVNEEKKSPLK